MRRTKETASQMASLVDWLADVIRGDIVLTATQFVQGNYDYVYCKIHFYGSFIIMCQQFICRPYQRENWAILRINC